MFKIGEIIIYGLSGVYEVTDVREETVLGKRADYYVLHSPTDKDAALLFVPVDNEVLTSQMRYPMTKDEAKALIASMDSIEPAAWIKDQRRRTEEYKRLISAAEPRMLISVIKAIRSNAEIRRTEGKKSYVADENVCQRAENLLLSELTISLGKSADAIVCLLHKAFNNT